MNIGTSKGSQIVFMAVVSALLGYAVFMVGQATLSWSVKEQLTRTTDEQKILLSVVEELNRRKPEEVTAADRSRHFERLDALVQMQQSLAVEIDRHRRLAKWPALAVGAGYFVICLGTFLRARKKLAAATFFLSPAAIAGVRDILEGPFDVGEGHVVLKRPFASGDGESLDVLQLVTKGLIESHMNEVILDVAVEKQPFSQFIGVLVSFAIDCDAAGKKAKILIAAEAKNSMEMVGLATLADLEIKDGD